MYVYRYFYRIVVCKYRPHWYCESIQGQLMPLEQLHCMSLEVVTPTEVDICLYQTSTRWDDWLLSNWDWRGRGCRLSVHLFLCVCVTFHLAYMAPYLSLLQTLLTSPSPFVPPTLTP